MLRAGIARSFITPPIGLTMSGYAAREGPAQDKDDELTVTALVLDDENNMRVAVLGFDLVFLREPLVSELRRQIGSALGIPASHVLLNFSHTHCGPALDGLKYDEDPDQEAMRRGYEDRLCAEARSAALLAVHRQRPARIGTGAGAAHIGVNRRETQPDGTVLLGEDPAGPVDHEVRVFRIDQPDGRPIAVMFAHGCHTVTMGPKCLRWSADYVGPAREIVERYTGVPSLFLQANAGDINPITGIGDKEDNTAEKNRLGWILGAEVLQVHSTIYTESERGPRTLAGSLSKLAYYPRVAIRQEPDSIIAVHEERLELPLLPLPPSEVSQSLLAHWENEYRTLSASRQNVPALHAAYLFRRWARELHAHVMRKAKPAISIPIQAMRIGQFAIVAVPGETFARQGLDLKSQVPFANTLFLGYSNGCESYIPTPDAYPEGGWSVTERYFVPDLLFQGYRIPTALAPECSNRILTRSRDLLRALQPA